MFKLCMKQVLISYFALVKNKDVDKTVQMHRLVGVFVVCMQESQVFWC